MQIKTNMANEIRASYTDTFEHAFDAKGRITVPAEWRAESFEARLFVLPSPPLKTVSASTPNRGWGGSRKRPRS